MAIKHKHKNYHLEDLESTTKAPSWSNEFSDWLDLLAQGVPYEDADLDNIKTRNRSNSIKLGDWGDE